MLFHRMRILFYTHYRSLLLVVFMILSLTLVVLISGIIDKSDEYALIDSLKEEINNKQAEIKQLNAYASEIESIVKEKDETIAELETKILEVMYMKKELEQLVKISTPSTSRGLSTRREQHQSLYVNYEEINKSSNLTKDEILIIATFAGLDAEVDALYEIDQNNINVFFAIAVSMIESSISGTEHAGKSDLAKRNNNIYGATAGSGEFIRYDSFSHSILEFGRFMQSIYFDRGLTTLSSVNNVYCPPNSKWKLMVASKMNLLYKHLLEYKGL